MIFQLKSIFINGNIEKGIEKTFRTLDKRHTFTNFTGFPTFFCENFAIFIIMVTHIQF